MKIHFSKLSFCSVHRHRPHILLISRAIHSIFSFSQPCMNFNLFSLFRFAPFAPSRWRQFLFRITVPSCTGLCSTRLFVGTYGSHSFWKRIVSILVLTMTMHKMENWIHNNVKAESREGGAASMITCFHLPRTSRLEKPLKASER